MQTQRLPHPHSSILPTCTQDMVYVCAYQCMSCEVTATLSPRPSSGNQAMPLLTCIVEFNGSSRVCFFRAFTFTSSVVVDNLSVSFQESTRTFLIKRTQFKHFAPHEDGNPYLAVLRQPFPRWRCTMSSQGQLLGNSDSKPSATTQTSVWGAFENLSVTCSS